MPLPYGWGFFLPFMKREVYEYTPPPLSPLFFPSVKNHPLTMYPFRSNHAMA